MTDKFTLQHTSGQADRFSLKVHKPTIDEELAACREINAELLAALKESRRTLAEMASGEARSMSQINSLARLEEFHDDLRAALEDVDALARDE